MLTAENIGQSAVIKAADEFFSFVDGWKGTIAGFQSGLVILEVSKEGQDMTFFVPEDQLEVIL